MKNNFYRQLNNFKTDSRIKSGMNKKKILLVRKTLKNKKKKKKFFDFFN